MKVLKKQVVSMCAGGLLLRAALPLPCLLTGACFPASTPLRLNELMASNTRTLESEPKIYPDWIELYNQGDTELSLEGFYLTDDLDFGDKAPLDSSLTIPAWGFLVLYADNGDVGSPMHVALSLKASGEELGLFLEQNGRLREVDWAVFGPQRDDCSLARAPDGEDPWVSTSKPTPGESNGE